MCVVEYFVFVICVCVFATLVTVVVLHLHLRAETHPVAAMPAWVSILCNNLSCSNNYVANNIIYCCSK